MTLAGSIRARRAAAAIEERSAFYSRPRTDVERWSTQLSLWNDAWRTIIRTVPYFTKLREERGLPARFGSWEEVVDLVPATTRTLLQREGKNMASFERPPETHRMTGGSTAQPIKLPAWHSEDQVTRPDRWLGRSWYGISPASRLFLLWGHSHLLGSGIKGWVNLNKRILFDRVLGYHRFSAYELQPEVLRRAARELIHFKPEYLIGYSVALDLFATANADLKNEFLPLGMKAVVGAAEGFPSQGSGERLQNMFGCPVTMEYGSVETDLMGHMHPGGGYRVFWRTYFIEAERASPTSIGLTVRVTSLYPRCCPLVRYEIGDEIEPWEPGEEKLLGIERFKRIIGRCNDYIPLKDGAMIHSEAFTHAVRSCSLIQSYQIVQTEADLRIRYTSSDLLPRSQVAKILDRLGRIHPALGQIELEKVESLQQTVAGKIRMVVRN